MNPATIWDLFGQPAWAARMESTVNQIRSTMTTVAEALADWTNYANGLKDQLAQAQSSLTDAQATIAQLQATDAAEDAAEAATLQDTIAQQIEDALAAVQNPPPPPATPDDTTPPADSGSVDVTPPPADTTPPDGSA